MAENSGFIRLHRCILDKPIWFKSTLEQRVILFTLLLMANHKESEWEWMGKKFKVQPGQFVTSLDSIVNRCGNGVSVRNVRTALERFEKLEFLTNKSTKTGRLITIVNWDLYQNKNVELTKELTKTRQRPDKDLTPNKNDNKDLRSKDLIRKDLKSVRPSVNIVPSIIDREENREMIEKIIKVSGIENYSPNTAVFMSSVITKIIEGEITPISLKVGLNHEKIKDCLRRINPDAVDKAHNKMGGCKTNKEIYFAKCLISAITESGFEELFTEEG